MIEEMRRGEIGRLELEPGCGRAIAATLGAMAGGAILGEQRLAIHHRARGESGRRGPEAGRHRVRDEEAEARREEERQHQADRNHEPAGTAKRQADQRQRQAGGDPVAGDIGFDIELRHR